MMIVTQEKKRLNWRRVAYVSVDPYFSSHEGIHWSVNAHINGCNRILGRYSTKERAELVSDQLIKRVCQHQRRFVIPQDDFDSNWNKI